MSSISEPKKLAQQRFGANAEAYATSKTHAQGKSLQRLIELTQPQPYWRVLDVATGAGHTALAFAPQVAHVIASDITPEMLAQAASLAKERGIKNVTTHIADAEQLPFDDGSFDLVTCRIAPHHFADVQHFVNECERVLKANALLAVDDNVAPEDVEAALTIDEYERLRDPSHVRCLPPSEWRMCFARAGLRVLRDETIEKQIGFDEWCGHQKTPDDVKAVLRDRLLNTTGAARMHLQPLTVDGVLKFSMIEGIFIGQKRSARRSVTSGTKWEKMSGFARAVRMGDHIWVSGTTATDGDGQVVGAGDAAEQTRFALRKIETALAQLGVALKDVVRTRIYVRNMADWEAVARVHGDIFKAIQPANTLVQADLVGDEYLVEVEADAYLG